MTRSLGTTRKNSVPQEKESGTKKRFRLQNAARDLLPGERVYSCCRKIAPIRSKTGQELGVPDTVELAYNPQSNKASLRGLEKCSSVWVCPVCVSRISEQRRQDIQHAIHANNHNVLLVTFTLRHNKNHRLSDLLHILITAQRKLKSGRFWQDIKAKYGWLGDVKSLEITYGQNGWHPHQHNLMFIDRGLTADEIESLQADLREKWQHVLWALGGDAEYKIGVDIQAGSQYVAEYLSKFGKMPEDDLDAGKGWDNAAEMTKSNHKIARGKDGKTPWGLLDEYSKTGCETAARLFKEYAKAVKGKHQITWSRGLKELFGIDQISDQDIDDTDQEAQPFLEIPKLAWASICISRQRAALLALVEMSQGDRRVVKAFIDHHHARMKKHKRRLRKQALNNVYPGG